LEKKFSNLSVEASTSKIKELSIENFSPLEVDLLTVATSKK